MRLTAGTHRFGMFDFQGLVFEEERPPPPNRAPLAPMLEFVSAQTGLPVVAVGGGSSLGREPQVRWLKQQDEGTVQNQGDKRWEKCPIPNRCPTTPHYVAVGDGSEASACLYVTRQVQRAETATGNRPARFVRRPTGSSPRFSEHSRKGAEK